MKIVGLYQITRCHHWWPQCTEASYSFGNNWSLSRWIFYLMFTVFCTQFNTVYTKSLTCNGIQSS